MLLSFNWLRELIPDLTESPVEVAEALTLGVFETEIAGQIKLDPKVTVAKIIRLDRHPDADRLQLATVTTGSESVQVVCGAPNLSPGDLVPFSPPGTNLLDPYKKIFTLKPAKIRGVESPGMLNSPRELGLGDWHGGIYLLPADTPLGSSLADHIPDDTILETDLTPNRAPDCYSHLGVARELAALLNHDVVEPDVTPLANKPLNDFAVTVHSSQTAPRYFVAQLTDLQIKPSPLQLQSRLWACGLKPINNIVDISNYVLLELGQPNHTFDASRLPANSIEVRPAQLPEQISLLDDNQIKLLTDDLVIASGGQPIALAGVMGGRATQVTQQTTQVLLEVANFGAYSIQETARAHKYFTDSSRRFSKGISPHLVFTAASRLVQLLEAQAGAQLVGWLDTNPKPAQPKAIKFNALQVTKIAGQEYSEHTVTEKLEQLRCKISGQNVTPPVERLDLKIAADLTEEVIRLDGYHNIAPRQLSLAEQSTQLPEHIQWRESVRDLLIQAGLSETYNYSFSQLKFVSRFNLSSPQFVHELKNPISPEQAYLRTSLLPSLLEHLIKNRSEFAKPFGAPERALFEIGTVFLSQEQTNLALALIGERATPAELNGVISDILDHFGLDQASHLEPVFWPASNPLVKKLKQPLATVELNLDSLISQTELSPIWRPAYDQFVATQFENLHTFPAVYRDLSLLVPADTLVETVQDIIERAGGSLVVDVDLFDEFQLSDNIRKSLAFHIAYQSTDKTLTAEEVGSLHNSIIKALKSELDTEIR